MVDPINRKNLEIALSKAKAAVTKQVGQHYLIDESVRDKVIEAGNLALTDTVVEIGPGLGTLTYALVPKVKKIIALEKDRRLGEYLRSENIANISVIIKDAVLALPSLLIEKPYKIISNLPYQITTPIIHRIFDAEPLPSLCVLMVQKEVADRLTAKPGSTKRGYITVLGELIGKFEQIVDVPPSSFWPAPHVNSAVIRFTPAGRPEDYAATKRIVKAGFSSRRRTLENALSGSLRLPKEEARELLNKAEIEPNLRAEALTTDQWRKLTSVIGSN